MEISLPGATKMGAASLVVSDLDRSLVYYQERIGLSLLRHERKTAVLGTPQRELLYLTPQPGADPVLRGVTGLYHFALLLPSRLELAKRLYHLGRTGTRFTGFADHGVSEALYLQDPDGHGIEIYRDRPRTEWRTDENGKLKMGTDPLDTDSLLAELHEEPNDGPVDPATVMGHMHLHIANRVKAESFYHQGIGFDLMMRYGPAASFMSAGGYHHHLGLNTWAGVGAPSPPETAARLLWYEIVLPDREALTALQDRLLQFDYPFRVEEDRLWVHDPSHNLIKLTCS